MDLNTQACIVGAGPGGALLGYLLAAQGVSVILLERHGHIDKEFRGEHLNAVGERILHQHGLYEQVRREGLLQMERVEYFQNGEIIKTILPGPGEEHTGIHVPQKNLLHVLLGQSLKFPNYRLMMDTTVTDLIRNPLDHQITGVRVRHDGKELTIHSRLVIGADGRYSTVRKLAGIQATIIKHGFDLLWARIPAPDGWPPTVRMALAQEAQLALFSQQGGYIQIGWNIPQDTYPQLRKSPVDPFVEALIHAFPELQATVQEHIRSWNDFVLLKVQSCVCDTWVQPGLVIMGDAAHTFSPTGAIGVNSAMQDAHVLAPLLLEALAADDVSLERLGAFEQLRRQETVDELDSQFMREIGFRAHFPAHQA
ncbi:FAD-dependent monooxygenase [Paenibacillus sp. Z6-24]